MVFLNLVVVVVLGVIILPIRILIQVAQSFNIS